MAQAIGRVRVQGKGCLQVPKGKSHAAQSPGPSASARARVGCNPMAKVCVYADL